MESSPLRVAIGTVPSVLTAARDQWVAAREQELLPVGYVHVVFTIPEVLARLALVNKRVVYDLLFTAAAATQGERDAQVWYLRAIVWRGSNAVVAWVVVDDTDRRIVATGV